MTLSVLDLFCGAGGSSTGLLRVPGLEVKVASNHWQLAIDTHGANHPDVDHRCANISETDPRRMPRTDILWASPECTNHSQAKGRKRKRDVQPDLFGETLPDEAAERSRATMWDVPRFAEIHRYQAIIVENVVDAALWPLFPAWLHAMDLLGYDRRIVWANSMHAQAGGLPAPQSRDRMYVCFWRKGNRPPDFDRWTRPQAWCPTCEEMVSAVQSWKRLATPWGRYRAQYVWRCPRVSCRNQVVEPGWLPAATAIDWNRRGVRIGDKPLRTFKNKKTGEVSVGPLAPKTMARIEAGIAKFYSEPFLQRAYTPRNNLAQMSTSLAATVPTLTASTVPGLLVPCGGGWNTEASNLVDPMRTRTATETEGVCLAPAFLSLLRSGRARNIDVRDVLATVVADGSNHALLVPVDGRDGVNARPAAGVMRTQSTRNETGLLVPYYGTGVAHTTGEPVGTLTATDRYALVCDTRQHAVPAIEDCEFRMLTPGEIAAGMAFPTDYTLLGNQSEKVRLAGNAVCPPNARDLGHAVAESLHAA